ncbi:MAG: hypothetical protein RL594_1435 [Bacteroidota bacterium]|jgi:outer membrane protein OmpA-like peptidoglycan-associated protein
MRLHLLVVSIVLLYASTAECRAQRFDADSLWYTQPPADSIFRTLAVGGTFGQAYHYTPGLECLEGGNCTPFDGGFGSVISFSVGADQAVLPYWNISASLSVTMWNASMSVRDASARVRMPDGSIANLVRELSLESKGTTLGLTVGPQYHREGWRLSLGPTLEMNIAEPLWQMRGRIVEPQGVRYPGGSATTTIVQEAPITNTSSLRYGLAAFVGKDLAISKKISITPTVGVQYLPSSLRQSSSWTDVRWIGQVHLRIEANDLPDTVERIRQTLIVDTIIATRAGQRADTLLVEGIPSVRADTVHDGLLRKISATIRRTDTLITIDPGLEQKMAEARRIQQLQIEESKRPITTITLGEKTLTLKPKRQISISIGGVEASTRDVDLPDTKGDITYYITEEGDTVDYRNRSVAKDLAIRLTAERQALTFMVMPSIFFDSGSAILPQRYRQISSRIGYEVERDLNSQHDVNLNILNILGMRMDSISENLIIRGFADETSEGADCELARSRALAVINYLTAVWGVSPERLRLEIATTSCAPDPASFGGTARGRQENRRVEILSEDNEFFQPIQKVNVVTKPEGDLSRATIDVSDLEDPVSDWEIAYRQGDRIIEQRRGLGAFRGTSLSLSDNVLDSLTKDPIIITIRLRTVSGGDTETDIEIPVVDFEKSKKFESLSLAMFAVRSTDLGKRDLELLKTFADRLDSGDRVAVLGYSDDLGNPTQNLRLSELRARAVADRLRSLRPDCEVVRVEGLASGRYPIGVTSYELPEQRFMSRTVQLVLERR